LDGVRCSNIRNAHPNYFDMQTNVWIVVELVREGKVFAAEIHEIGFVSNRLDPVGERPRAKADVERPDPLPAARKFRVRQHERFDRSRHHRCDHPPGRLVESVLDTTLTATVRDQRKKRFQHKLE
jgi:hypothetical protein